MLNMLQKTFSVLIVVAFVSPNSETNERNLYRDDSLQYLNMVKDQERLLPPPGGGLRSKKGRDDRRKT